MAKISTTKSALLLWLPFKKRTNVRLPLCQVLKSWVWAKKRTNVNRTKICRNNDRERKRQQKWVENIDRYGEDKKAELWVPNIQ